MNFKGIAVCLFFFVLGSCLKAQDYVYPALPSEMWGIEIFKEQEQQMVIDESSFMPQGAPSIGVTYARYEQNLDGKRNKRCKRKREIRHSNARRRQTKSLAI